MTARKRRGFTIIELAFVFGIAAFYVALLLPAVQQAREAARRTQCKDNLHNLGLAMHNYYEVFNRLPCGWYQHSWDADEPDAIGWATSILPFADHAPLYNRIDFDLPPSLQSSDVIAAMQGEIVYYRCPTDPSDVTNLARGEWGTMNYSANFGHQPLPRWETGTLTSLWPGMASTPMQSRGLLWCNGSARFPQIVDGMSNTVMVGERCTHSTNGIWMGVRGNAFENDAVTDGSRYSPLNGGIGTFSSMHVGGAHILLSDGAVRFVSEEVSQPRVVARVNAGRAEDPDPAYIMELLTCRDDGMPINQF